MRLQPFHHLVPHNLRIGFKHVAIQRARKFRHIRARHVRQFALIQIQRELNHKQGEAEAFPRLRTNAHELRKIGELAAAAAACELLQHRLVVPLFIKQLLVPRVIVEHHGRSIVQHWRISVKHVFQNNADILPESLHIRLL